MMSILEQLQLLDLQLQQERVLLFSPPPGLHDDYAYILIGHWVLYGFYILLHKTNKNKTLNLKLGVFFLLLKYLFGDDLKHISQLHQTLDLLLFQL
jgi:hypothetical protein